jgi:glycosyltransferase involved in cell wall biosynthesis
LIPLSLISPETLEKIKNIGKADILIGIPSLNNEKTISHVAKAIKLGLIKYFPKQRAVIVNLDSNSSDKTIENMKRGLSSSLNDLENVLMNKEYHPVFRGTAIPPEEVIVVFSRRGKGNAFRRFFKIAEVLDVKACAVFDSDLRSITPEWIQLLLGPILFHGYDYVAPFYCRHKYDGTITNSLAYPLTTALYGKRIRQPIGGEFGFSRKAVRHYLSKKHWKKEVSFFGIDIWMTTIPLAEGLKVCQSFLGSKVHDPKDPSSSLTEMFTQVVGTIFELALQYYEKWKDVERIEPVRTFGFATCSLPEEVKVNYEKMVERFKEGSKVYSHFWQRALEGENFEKIIEISRHSMEEEFLFPKESWVKTIYDFIAYYASRKTPQVKRHLLSALVPLYLGYTASFVNKTKAMNAEEAEKEVQELVEEFFKHKPYLIKKLASSKDHLKLAQ